MPIPRFSETDLDELRARGLKILQLREEIAGQQKAPAKTKSSPVRGTAQGWYTVGDCQCYFRSKWEYRYALVLEYRKNQGLIKNWEYEPKTFWFESIKRGRNTYKPDFMVTETGDQQTWHEVKGHLDARSNTLLKRFKKYYPAEAATLQLIDATWFKANPQYKTLLSRLWDANPSKTK